MIMIGLFRKYFRKCTTLLVGCGLIWLLVTILQVHRTRFHEEPVDLNYDGPTEWKSGVMKEMDDYGHMMELTIDETKEEHKKRIKILPPAPAQERLELIIPVLVLACDRVTVLRCLNSLVETRSNRKSFPIIISQDCGHNKTLEVIKQFAKDTEHVSYILQPDHSEIEVPANKIAMKGYYKIARHYKFALNYVLGSLGYDAVIIVEDDLDVAQDFYEYFLGTYPLMKQDKSIWCISAWNDNGKKDLIEVRKPSLLHRTQFFPGLGWLITQTIWQELEPKWPKAFWDDWLRTPEVTKMRSCIRPEVSRTYSFGEVGVSRGQYFKNHLRYIKLNDDFREFTRMDLSYLLEKTYNENLLKHIYTLPVLAVEEVLASRVTSDVLILYYGEKDFKRTAKLLGLMDDFRGGIPRTSYYGIVTCFVRGRRIYVAPENIKRIYHLPTIAPALAKDSNSLEKEVF